MNEFIDIEPYNDAEAVEALSKVANHPGVIMISKYLFPYERPTFLRDLMVNINSIDEFQRIVMSQAVEWCLNNTTHEFTYSGIENLKESNGKFLMVSNHRDIIVDPALTQYVLLKNGIDLSQIAVGDNLLSNQTVEYLLRSNRMIKVIRGISARELFLSSQLLSKYIRKTITSGESSVWIAQRQGRTKDGLDTTEQGLLKMLDMSGAGGFKENFMELGIYPLSISYEYEPCDIRKAREILISKDRKYVKRPNEDLHSIIIGLRQQKGDVHLTIGSRLSEEAIDKASEFDKNDRYQQIRHELDRRVVEGYKLWKTNYLSYDIVNKTSKYSSYYTREDVERFEAYTEHKLDKVERFLDREALRDIFLRIYANPVLSKETLV